MDLIIITQPHLYEGETDAVNALLEQGFTGRLHLRKPTATREQTACWLEQIAPQHRPRIVLHDHHDLAPLYHVGGIHLSQRHPTPPSTLPPGLTVSRSCHTIGEVRAYADTYDYLLLSPIFDSISKPGYHAAFTPAELQSVRPLLARNVYALGGITRDLLPQVERLGFRGAAMMGGFWRVTDIIFDLGGVLLNLDMQRAAAAAAQIGLRTDDPRTAELLDAYQVGRLSTQQFLTAAQSLLPPGTTPAAIVDAWMACLGSVPHHRLQLIRQLRHRGYSTHLLSNTNQLHWDCIERRCFAEAGYTCADLFDHVWLSQQVHLAKPDPAIYRLAVQQTGHPAAQCFFIDDTRANVEAACREGLQSAWLDVGRPGHLGEILQPFL